MLDVVSMWFSQLRSMELHSYINSLVSSGVGLFLLIPVAITFGKLKILGLRNM